MQNAKCKTYANKYSTKNKQVKSWIEISVFIDDILVFIGNISRIYRISDGPKTILSTNYRTGGISEKYREYISVWN